MSMSGAAAENPASLAEAKDNVKYLYAIAEVTRPLIVEFPDALVDSMPHIVHSIAWMACISRFFNTPDRLASMFYRLSTRVVKACKRSIYAAWHQIDHGARTSLFHNKKKGEEQVSRRLDGGSARSNISALNSMSSEDVENNMNSAIAGAGAGRHGTGASHDKIEEAWTPATNHWDYRVRGNIIKAINSV